MPNDATTEISIRAAVKTVVDKSALNQTKKEIETSLSNIDVGKGWGAMKGVLGVTGKVATAPIKQLGNAVKDTIKHLGGFFAALKRIAIYRAIRSALKDIIQGFKEGIQNAYQWSVVTGNQFARSMDMMATSALYLKNSLGAMTMPLMNYLAPILDRITDQFVELINVVNRFIATITGAGSWVKALKYPAQYMEQAAGSAKELKNQLLGFDELNVLNAPNGGGGGAALDYSKMFENVTLSSTGFSQALKDAIKKGDWKGIGKLFATKFNEMIANINALDLSASLGKKLNDVISFVHALLEESNFHQVGVKIGEFMSNLRLNWGAISASWVRWNTNILDALLGLISGVNWSHIGKAIGDYISGLFKEFANWLKQVDWYAKGQEFTQAIIDLISNVNWHSVASAIWEALKGALNAALGLLNGALGQVEFDRWGQVVSVPTPTSSYSQAQSAAQEQGYTIPPGMPPAQAAYLHSIGKLANGGFPDQGSIFLAGEAGPELVAQIGGRTGVMNTEQMSTALAAANENVVDALTAVGNAVIGAIHNQQLTINTNDVRKAIHTMNLRYGV